MYIYTHIYRNNFKQNTSLRTFKQTFYKGFDVYISRQIARIDLSIMRQDFRIDLYQQREIDLYQQREICLLDTREEARIALFAVDDNKAPGIDEFKAYFL